MDTLDISRLVDFLASVDLKKLANEQEVLLDEEIADDETAQKLVLIWVLLIKEKGLLQPLSEILNFAFEYRGAEPMIQEFIRRIKDSEPQQKQLEDKDDVILIMSNDRPNIKKHLKEFKMELHKLIEAKGGVTEVARIANLSQPSLSRLLNSPDMIPQSGTLEALFGAIGLKGVLIRKRVN